MTTPDRVYVVDDDAPVRRSMALLLDIAGYAVSSFASGAEFLAACDSSSRGCVLLDINMPGLDGIATAEALRARGAKLAILFMTGRESADTETRARAMDLEPILEKPVLPDTLLDAIQAALARLPD